MHRKYTALFTLALLASLLMAFELRAGSPAADEKDRKEAGTEKEKKKAKRKERKKNKAAKSPAEEAFDTEMAAWMEIGTPGAPHKRLEAHVGKWNVQGKFWHEAGAPPMDATGVSTIRSILGGRFIQETYKSKFMGMSFQGLGLTGYDNVKKKYVAVWTDSMSTALMSVEGSADESGVLTFVGSYYDPAKKKEVRTKMIHRREGPDRLVSESYMIDGEGKETLSMSLVYTRAAKAEKKPRAQAKKTEKNSPKG